MQMQLPSDDRPTLWQVLEGYLDDIRRKIAGMNLFDDRRGSPAPENLPPPPRGPGHPPPRARGARLQRLERRGRQRREALTTPCRGGGACPSPGGREGRPYGPGTPMTPPRTPPALPPPAAPAGPPGVGPAR